MRKNRSFTKCSTPEEFNVSQDIYRDDKLLWKIQPKVVKFLSLLYKLQETKSSHLTIECEEAFTQIRQEITADRNLNHYYLNLPLKFICDASNEGIGVALLHIYLMALKNQLYLC